MYALAILIAFFSGAWPYMKLFIMLFSWAAPSTLLTMHRRETYLQVVDALGKWSLIDFYVMMLMLHVDVSERGEDVQLQVEGAEHEHPRLAHPCRRVCEA